MLQCKIFYKYSQRLLCVIQIFIGSVWASGHKTATGYRNYLTSTAWQEKLKEINYKMMHNTHVGLKSQTEMHRD